ncbi:unnamed protein product [Caenorhabditis nigoni]
MNEAIVKEEVIEEDINLTFKNGEYVEVKQEEVEEKPENLLEKEIKTEPIDSFENSNWEKFFEATDRKQELIDSRKEKVSEEVNELRCEICKKTMPRNLLKLIKSEEDITVLSQFFKFEGSLETRTPFVCYSHIQAIIDDNEEKFKRPKKPTEHLMRSFIRRNKYLRKDRAPPRRICKVCHISRNSSELCETRSKGIRMVIMIRCILHGTHSVEQATSCILNYKIHTCYSHCKESIDEIFEYLGVKSIGEFSKCPTIGGLMDIAKDIDPNFTVQQFLLAFRELCLKNLKFECNL